MMNIQQIKDYDTNYVLKRWLDHEYPVAVRGEGVYLYDIDDNKYLDGTGGPVVSTIGHGIQEIADAIYEQAKQLCFSYTGGFHNVPQILLAQKIAEMSPEGITRSYFLNGGSEATEVALKIARHYQLSQGRESRWKIISRWQSFHGTTMGAMSMSGRSSSRADYQPYLAPMPKIVPCYCYRCPYDRTYPECGVKCAYDLERVIKQEGPKTIAGFIAEPIGGTAIGISVPPKEYYQIIQSICDKYDILFIADEVMCGFGRTGKNFGMDHYGVSPDVMTTGKGIAGGYGAIAAASISEKVYETALHPVEGRSMQMGGSFLGYTYTGNPLGCAAGVAVQKYIEKHKLIQRSARIGEYIGSKMNRLLDLPMVGDIRGLGCFYAIEFVKDKKTKEAFPKALGVSGAVHDATFKRGMYCFGGGGLVDGEDGDFIAFTPPFIITEEEVDTAIDIFEEAIKEVQREFLS
jgi:adenosylmethionine-8-amino-7-oxononanoate aminotransferase